MAAEAPAFAGHVRALQAAHFDDEGDAQPQGRDSMTPQAPGPSAVHVGNLVLAPAPESGQIDAFAAQLGEALHALAVAADWQRLLLVPLAPGARWCEEDGRTHPPLRAARAALRQAGVGPRFGGALVCSPSGMAHWAGAWFWMVRCGALAPGVAFGVSGHDLMGELCPHGNLHLCLYGTASPDALSALARSSGWRVVNEPCGDAFGPAIAGRQLLV